MPFTGSHPAAVVPLMRAGLIPSALVIGSMVPDLPYYLPVPISFDFTHTIAGVLSIDLAMAAVCFALWQALAAPVAIALAPAALRERLAPRFPVPWRTHVTTLRAVALVVASTVVGALTHVLWDEFTHQGHWGARHIGWLAARHGPFDGYRWAQYASGVFGAAVIAWAAWRWWATTPLAGAASDTSGRTDQQRIPALPRSTAIAVWGSVIGAAAITGAAGFLIALSRDELISRSLYRAATWGGAAGLLVAFFCALACARLLRNI